jgi:hypothetical protein
MKRGVLAIVLGCGPLGACAPVSAASDGQPQSLCERSDRLQDVERYDGSFGVPTAFVNRHRLAVGLLRWRSDLRQRYLEQAGNVQGQGWCSGTLIDDDLFLTAGHCLDPTDSGGWQLPREKGGIELRPAELARELVVELRYEASVEADAPTRVDSAEVLRLEEYRRGELDYAILRLGDHPGLRNGTARISPRDAEPGARVAILQHPAAASMKIGAGPVARVQGSTLSYDSIDTLGGSSGAGILDVETGKLVGVHTTGGCAASGGGENSGVTIRALTAVSPILQKLVDNSKDLLVGDWDQDGRSDLAVLVAGCVYPDTDHDGAPDAKACPAEAKAGQYFVGNWQIGSPSGLGWRQGNCVYLDAKPAEPLCFGDPPFEILVADWNGDGRSDLGVRTGACIDFDLDLDGAIDERGYCYGEGAAEDEYLVGNWNGDAHASIAVRRGSTVLVDVDRDGRADVDARVYGNGGAEHQYLVGDWDGDRRTDLGVRRGTECLLTHDPATGLPDERRAYDDFWSAP